MLLSGSAGVLLGLAARLTMRWVALESGVSPGFSTGGSFEVVALGVALGAPAAFLFFLVQPQAARMRPWSGLLWGLALFALLAAFPTPAARSALADTPDTPLFTAVAFATLFAAWGLSLALLQRRFLGGFTNSSHRPALPSEAGPVQ